MPRFFPVLAGLFLSLTPADSSKLVVGRFEARYRGAKAMRATFLESYSENGRVVRAEAGTAYFRRPGRMRWEYGSPEKSLFLVDGKHAWFYVPRDRTVTRMPARESADWRTPLALLAGEARLSKVCAATALAPDVRAAVPGNAMVRCTLRGAEKPAKRSAPAERQAQATAPEDDVLLEIGEQSGELGRVLIRQKGGTEIEFKFENWQLDASVPDALFRFTPPAGVAIVDGEGLLPDPGQH